MAATAHKTIRNKLRIRLLCMESIPFPVARGKIE